MGKLGLWFLSKDKEQLEAYKAIVAKKKDKSNKKYDDKLNKIDDKIAKC